MNDVLQAAAEGDVSSIEKVHETLYSIASEAQQARQIQGQRQQQDQSGPALHSKSKPRIRPHVAPYPDATKVLEARPRPLSQLSSGRRTVPTLTSTQGIPFLRFKKKQSAFLGRVLRDKIRKKLKTGNAVDRCEEGWGWGVEEEKWEGNVLNEMRKEKILEEEQNEARSKEWEKAARGEIEWDFETDEIDRKESGDKKIVWWDASKESDERRESAEQRVDGPEMEKERNISWDEEEQKIDEWEFEQEEDTMWDRAEQAIDRRKANYERDEKWEPEQPRIDRWELQTPRQEEKGRDIDEEPDEDGIHQWHVQQSGRRWEDWDRSWEREVLQLVKQDGGVLSRSEDDTFEADIVDDSDYEDFDDVAAELGLDEESTSAYKEKVNDRPDPEHGRKRKEASHPGDGSKAIERLGPDYGKTGSEGWVKAYRLEKRRLRTVGNKDQLKNKEMGRRMLEIVDQERALWEKEEDERKQRKWERYLESRMARDKMRGDGSGSDGVMADDESVVGNSNGKGDNKVVSWSPMSSS